MTQNDVESDASRAGAAHTPRCRSDRVSQQDCVSRAGGQRGDQASPEPLRDEQ